MRELQRTSFGRSWNFMKANEKISLVISSVSLILLVFLILFYFFFSIVDLTSQIFGFFTVHQILIQILLLGGPSSQRTFTLFLDEKALRSSEY